MKEEAVFNSRMQYRSRTCHDIIISQMCNINEKSYIKFLRHGAQQIFFVILDCFLAFYSSNNLKNQNFENRGKKIAWRYHHFTQVYQMIMNDHILHCSWDTTNDGCNFYFSFWDIFALSNTPPLLNKPKSQNL